MTTDLIPLAQIAARIYLIRGLKVMLDRDLAELYEVETKVLKRNVRRHLDRFPDDFMFELSPNEYQALRRQFGTLKRGAHPKYLPFAFTEQGIAMLSAILNSKRAIQVNIQIMRVFVKTRRFVLENEELRQQIETLREQTDERFQIVFEALDRLIAVEKTPKRKIGF